MHTGESVPPRLEIKSLETESPIFTVPGIQEVPRNRVETMQFMQVQVQ